MHFLYAGSLGATDNLVKYFKVFFLLQPQKFTCLGKSLGLGT